MEQATVNSILLSMFASFMAFLATWFWFVRNATTVKAAALAAEAQTLMLRVAELETKERLTGQAMTPIITAFQSLLIKQLTHTDKPEMDALMVKVGPPYTLEPHEEDRLAVMLEERSRDFSPEISQAERDAAKLMPLVMPLAREEQANFKDADAAQDLKLVTIVSVVGTHEEDPRKTKEKLNAEINQ